MSASGYQFVLGFQFDEPTLITAEPSLAPVATLTNALYETVLLQHFTPMLMVRVLIEWPV